MATEPDFTVYSKTVGDLLDASKLHLEVPQYQRPYEWKFKQVSDLLNDIHNSHNHPLHPVEGIDRQLLLGSILLYRGRNTEVRDIVDGQQRLCTLVLLLSVVHRHLSVQ